MSTAYFPGLTDMENLSKPAWAYSYVIIYIECVQNMLYLYRYIRIRACVLDMCKIACTILLCVGADICISI